jgi:hypothetical protein
MDYVHPNTAPINLPRIDPADVVAFIDTVELFVRNFARHDPRRLRRADLLRLRRIQPFHLYACRDRRNRWRKWGYRITIHQPSREALRELDRIQQRCRSNLCRIDLAIDFSVDAASKAAVKDWLVRHAILRYRRSGPMHDEENTTSWVKQSARTRRSNRDMIVYCDRPSKLTGEVDVIHLELKILRAGAVGDLGYRRVRDLFDLNPRKIITRCVALFEVIDYAEWRRKAIRKMVRRTRAKHMPTTDTYEQDFVSGPPESAARYIDDSIQGRAQRVKDCNIQRAKMQRLSWLDWHIPERVTYGKSTLSSFPDIFPMISTTAPRRLLRWQGAAARARRGDP